MEQINPSRIAETILTAPGWARLGIAAPAPHLRCDAAQELARVIVLALEAGTTGSSAVDEPVLPL